MTKPIALLITDTHLKNDNLNLVFDIFKQCLKVAKEEGVDYIIHAGDFFTDRVGQNLRTLLCMRDILNLFEKSNIELIGIPGNHDKTNQDSENSYLDIFENYKNFNLIKKEEIVQIEDVNFCFIPFFTNSYSSRVENIKEELEGSKKKNFLVTHAAFNGVRNNDGTLVENGVSPEEVKFFDKVFVGHYHDESYVGDNIHYFGSAYQANFGENSEDKGFTLLYNDGLEVIFNSNFPKYLKVNLDVNSDISNELEAYGDIEDNVRFIFKGNKDDFNKIDQSELEELGIECKFEREDLSEEIFKAETGEFESFDKKTILKFFKEYCEINEIDKKKRAHGIKLLLR